MDMSTTVSVPLPVWIVENDIAVRYYGVRYSYKREEFYCLFSSHTPRLIKRLSARDVYLDASSALKSLVLLDCWYIDADKVITANGYCKPVGTLIAFDKSTNERIWQREIYSTSAKAQACLLQQRRNEKRKLRSLHSK